MDYSNNCINLVKSFEGLQLTDYVCPAGKVTIGYGHTGSDVLLGTTISEAYANLLLRADLDNAYRNMIALVKVPLTQGQKDALTSFVFNLGAGNLKSSTLLTKLNASDYQGAAEELLKWCHAGKVELPGLVKRRVAEQALFLA